MSAGGALFDPLAELYERYAEINDGVYRPWLTAALDSAVVGGPRGRAADLGCGTGRFDELLADRYGSVLAVDVSARELEIARSRHGRDTISYRQRSLLDVTPETDGRFDLVFSVNTIFHLRDHDRVLPHVRSLVAPGGWAVLVDIVSPGTQPAAALRPAAPLVRRGRRAPDPAPAGLGCRRVAGAAAPAAQGLDGARGDQPAADPRRSSTARTATSSPARPSPTRWTRSSARCAGRRRVEHVRPLARERALP